jgi:hypothetical protein
LTRQLRGGILTALEGQGADPVGKLWGISPKADGFARVFGLNDDPFNPRRVPVKELALLSNLYKRPLQLERDHALDELFVPEAGPFAEHLEEFDGRLEIAGYHDNPVMTIEPFAFLVSGEEGTGKSTLVSAFARWMSEYKIPHWERLDYPPPGTDPGEPPGLYHYLSTQLKGISPHDYCYLVIDNVDATTQLEAMLLYQEFSRDRPLIMFLITKDLELLHDAGHNHPVDLQRFQMQPLTPDQAVIFVAKRITRCRIGAHAQQLRDFELFPFLASDIRQVVAEKDGHFQRGPVTLRVLASTLHALMVSRLTSNGPDIELAGLSRREIEDQLIILRPAYGELVA